MQALLLVDCVDQTSHHAPCFSVWIHILLGFWFWYFNLPFCENNSIINMFSHKFLCSHSPDRHRIQYLSGISKPKSASTPAYYTVFNEVSMKKQNQESNLINKVLSLETTSFFKPITQKKNSIYFIVSSSKA